MFAFVQQLLSYQFTGIDIDQDQLHRLGQDHERVLLVAALDVIDVRTVTQRHLSYARHRLQIEEVDVHVLLVLDLVRIVDGRENFRFLHDREQTLVQTEAMEAQRQEIMLSVIIEMTQPMARSSIV